MGGVDGQGKWERSAAKMTSHFVADPLESRDQGSTSDLAVYHHYGVEMLQPLGRLLFNNTYLRVYGIRHTAAYGIRRTTYDLLRVPYQVGRRTPYVRVIAALECRVLCI